MSALDEISTLEQAASFLKVNEAKLRRLVNARKIAVLKQGHTLTFPRAALEAYVEKYTTPVTAPEPWGMTTTSARRIRGRSAA